MYTVREYNEDGIRKDFPCNSYEEARELLDNLAGLDKNGHTGEIKHGEEHYSRIESETLKSYALSIVMTFLDQTPILRSCPTRAPGHRVACTLLPFTVNKLKKLIDYPL